ncbi:MAG: hypothetical protein GX333_00565, partial [Syntrophomonadaceae bacterium]|nr:hypothetical protein [Syntrophomonadaceae bacterium]
MKKSKTCLILIFILFVSSLNIVGCNNERSLNSMNTSSHTITDMAGREVTV